MRAFNTQQATDDFFSGGAAGQHACLVADALGMKQVFLHPYAGVLSAYGMGLADIRRILDVTIERELNGASLQEVREQAAAPIRDHLLIEAQQATWRELHRRFTERARRGWRAR